MRHGAEIWVYSAPLGVAIERVGQEYRTARKLVDESRERDLVRGFTLVYVIIAAAIWLVSLALSRCAMNTRSASETSQIAAAMMT